MYDLIVIGGGPAGTSTAITAARGGARVLVLERGQFPRHKVCGEFVSPESLTLLHELLDSSFLDLLDRVVRISRVRFFIDRQVLHAPLQPAAASIARLELDNVLWQSALKSGVETRQRVLVRDISGSGPFAAATSIGHFEACAIVNASGRWSNLTVPQSATNNREEKWLGLKAHFSQPIPSDSVDLYFFEGGYCGVQPVSLHADLAPSRINACAMVRADVATSIADVLERHLALRERATLWQPLMNSITVSPLIFGTPCPVRDGILFVGDAAGFIDPFVGDGISLALRSGALAAQCLNPFFHHKISLPQAIAQYAEQYQRRFTRVFRSSSRIRRMLSLPRPVRSPILAFLANRPSVAEYFVRKTR
jgi:flavin-dependent dehydrogenase